MLSSRAISSSSVRAQYCTSVCSANTVISILSFLPLGLLAGEVGQHLGGHVVEHPLFGHPAGVAVVLDRAADLVLDLAAHDRVLGFVPQAAPLEEPAVAPDRGPLAPGFAVRLRAGG